MTQQPASPPPAGLLSPENRLFVLARSGRLRIPQAWLDSHPVLLNKIFYPLLVLVFAFLTPIISSVLGLPFFAVSLAIPDGQPDLSFSFYLIGGFLGIFFLIWIWLRIFEQRPLWTTGLTRPVLAPYLRGLGIGLLLFGSVVILMALFGFLAVEDSGTAQRWWISLAGTLLVLIGWIVQGAAEELLARGFLLPILGVRWGPLAGVLVSSLFFSVLHLANPNVGFISLANLFLFGLLTALYALYEGGLWGVFAIHSIWNWAQGNLFGFEVSGLDARSSILYDLMEAGPDWVTGGLFGPEGGIAATIILSAGIIVIIIMARRRGSNGAAAQVS